jgi:hypothetical protein
MRKLLVIAVAIIAYVAALNLTAFIANNGFGWLSVLALAGAMVGGTYVVDRMV